MKKSTIYKMISIIFLIITIFALVCGAAAAGGKFTDLSISNSVRGFCIAIATASAGLALFFYRKSK